MNELEIAVGLHEAILRFEAEPLSASSATQFLNAVRSLRNKLLPPGYRIVDGKIVYAAAYLSEDPPGLDERRQRPSALELRRRREQESWRFVR